MSTPRRAHAPHDHGGHPAHEHDLVAHAPESFERAAAIFRAAGDVERLRLLERLLVGEHCVSELAAELEEGLSTVSERLKILRQFGLVSRRRAGKHIYYALADEHVKHLLEMGLAHAGEATSAAPQLATGAARER